jgi:thioredoxin reductase (NADPH)
MTGFAPNTALLAEAGVPIDPATGIPQHDPATLETSEAGLFIAGVVVAGYDANKIFIENGPVPRRPDRGTAARPGGAGGASAERGAGFLNKLRELVSWIAG